eukprot:156574_1
MSAEEFELLPSQDSDQVNDEDENVIVNHDPDEQNSPELITDEVQLVNSESVSLESSKVLPSIPSHNSHIQEAIHAPLMQSSENHNPVIPLMESIPSVEDNNEMVEEVMNVPNANEDSNLIEMSESSDDSDMNMEQTPPTVVQQTEPIIPDSQIHQSHYNNEAKDEEEEGMAPKEGIQQPPIASAIESTLPDKIYDNPYYNGSHVTPGDGGEDGEASDMSDLDDLDGMHATPQDDDDQSDEEKEAIAQPHEAPKAAKEEVANRSSKNNLYLSVMIACVAIAAASCMFYKHSTSPSPAASEAPKLHCPSPMMYVPLDGNEFVIEASHSDHPVSSTRYEWDVVDVDAHEDLFVDGENTGRLSLFSTTAGSIDIDLQISCSVNNNYVITKQCSMNVMFHEIPLFGIDLGTTYSCIAYQDRQSTNIVVLDQHRGEHCIPTAVYYNPLEVGGVMIGEDALKKLASDPLNVIYDIKRIVGRNCDDAEIGLFNEKHLFAVSCDDGLLRIFVANLGDYIYPEQALAVILGHLVEVASFEFGVPYIGDVVVSIPALFHNGQRKAIRAASELVGLRVRKLVVEPTAAALAYSYYSSTPKDNFKLFLAFDFGGGTLDCSVMRCTGVDCQVLGVKGNSSLGGIDFDGVIRDIMIDKYETQHSWHNVRQSDALNAKFLKVAERVKKSLSVSSQHHVTMTNDVGDKKQIVITRREFEAHPQTQELIDYAIQTAKAAIDNKRIRASNIRMILMIGGTTKIPMIQRRLSEEFGANTERLKLVFPSDDAQLMVVKGSAIIGASLSSNSHSHHKQIVLEDVIPLSLGFSICLIDSSSDMECGIMDVIIEKNSHYPTATNVTYCQKDPSSSIATLHLYEGESEFVRNNYLLSHLSISNIPKRNANDACDSIIVEFVIDKNGIAQIHATVNDKNKTKFYSQLSVVSNDSNLSKKQIKHAKVEVMQWFKGHDAVQNANI